MYCEKCGGQHSAGARFCWRCGAPVTSSPDVPTTISPVEAHGAPRAERTNTSASTSGASSRPPAIVLVSLVVLVGAGLLLYVAIRTMVDVGPGLAENSKLSRALSVALFVLAFVIATFGATLAGIAVMLWRGNRVGRALAWAMCGAAAVAELVDPARTAVGTWTLVALIVIAGLLALPDVGRFLAVSDGRPTAVVTAVVLIGYFAWDVAIVGAVLIPLGSIDTTNRVTGIVTLAAALALVLVMRALSAGHQWARIVASMFLVGAGVALVVAGHRSPSMAGLAALSGLTALTLWVAPGSGAFFAGERSEYARAVRAWTPGVAVAAVAGCTTVVAALAIGFHGATRDGSDYVAADVPTDSYGPPDSGPSYDPSPIDPDSTPPTDIESAGAEATYTKTLTFYESVEGGSGTVTLEVGDPQAYTDAPENGSATLGACDVDPDTTLVIPYKLEMTNTGNGARQLGIQFDGIGSSSLPDVSGPILLQEASYSDGESCNGDDGSSSFTTYTTNELDEGYSSDTYGFFLITDYNDSSLDISESELVAQAELTVDQEFSVYDESIDVTIDSASGPGLASDAVSSTFSLGG